MKHVIEHNLAVEPSKRIAEKAFSEYQRRFAKYNPSLVWLDDRRAEFGFTAKGMSLTGTIELTHGALKVEMDVPLLLRVFKGPAMRVLDNEMKRLIAEDAATTGQKGVA